MKARRRSRLTQACTLIELLMVIGIIAGLAIPTISDNGKGKGKRVQAQTALKDITLGITHYHTEYNRYPLPPGQTSEEPIPLSEGSTVLKILLGQNEQKLNPRETRYIEPQVGKGGAGGLTGTEGSYALMDPWGMPYEVIVDANGDDKIANPDARNADPAISSSAPPYLFMGAAALSFGPDKKPNTTDDVVSWR
jgi:type II secretory pathway pseudopilin PulG